MDSYELMEAAEELCEGLDPETCHTTLVEVLGQQAVDRLTNIYFPYPFNRHVYARKIVRSGVEATVVQAVVPPTVTLVTKLESEFVTEN